MKRLLLTCLFFIFCIFPLFSQQDIGNKLFEYDETTVFEGVYFSFADYTLSYKYYPYADTVIVTSYLSKRKYDEDTLNFALYCFYMSFIEDEEHFYSSCHEIYRRKYEEKYAIKTVVKYKLEWSSKFNYD